MAGVIPWEKLREGGQLQRSVLGQLLPFTVCQSTPDAAGMLGILVPKGGNGMQLLPNGSSLPAFWGQQRGNEASLGAWSFHPHPEAWKWEDPRLPEYLTSDRGRVQLDQWGVCILLWSNAWDTQASAGVLIIITVLKLKGLSRVLLRLWGGA